MIQLKKLKPVTEHVKQQQQELQKVLRNTIRPHENHTIFEYNLRTKEIRIADLEPESKEITWAQAVAKDYGRKRVVILKDYCIYDTALNVENFKKILRRDHNISC